MRLLNRNQNSSRGDGDRANQSAAEVKGMLAAVMAQVDAIGHRTGRPYFYLHDGWALSMLSTGQPFFVNTFDKIITPWILMGGVWETNVDNILCALSKPGMHIVDVGAQMGYYTVKLGGLVGPSGRIDAFEPNPEILPFLEANIHLNGLAQANLHRLALGAQKGSAQLAIRKTNPGSPTLTDAPDVDRIHSVELDAMDSALDKSARPDVLKIDAEGFEREVLRGASQILERSPNCAILTEVGLGCWGKTGGISELRTYVADRKPFAILSSGKLRPMAFDQMTEFLLGTPHEENYFLFLPEQHQLSVARFIDS